MGDRQGGNGRVYMSIQVKNLSHTYAPGLPHETKALEDISFNIDEGEMVGIIGHTGSGKSTLVQHLNGLLKPTQGEICVDGINITDPKTSMLNIRKKIGLVFQYPEYQLFEETVEKDVAFGPKNLGLEEEEVGRRVKEALELVGLDYEKVKDQSPFNLSGGQKRRVAIAGVIAMQPKVLILDEPTAGLDPMAHKAILNMVGDIHRAQKNITVFVSHNMNDIASMCDRILVMKRGHLELMGSPEEVFAEAKELRAIGLDLPEATHLIEDLQDRGLPFESGIFSMEKAEAAILKILKKTEEEKG